MPFQIIRNDIAKVKADAIVNTANPEPVIGTGTDSAVYSAAGAEALLAERRKIGTIEPGQAASTHAYDLAAKYIIHTVGPVWIDGFHKEREVLSACYRNSLSLADKLGCKSVAFPLISTGVYGFPRDEALRIAISEFSRFLMQSDMKITLVVFDRRTFELSGKLIEGIEEYIDENMVRQLHMEEYKHHRFRRGTDLSASLPDGGTKDGEPLFGRGTSFGGDGDLRKPFEWPKPGSGSTAAVPDISGKNLDEFVKGSGETFQQRLFHLIDESGMDDVTVYKKANIDRKVFSRIRCKADYKPKKKTAVAFAIALQLDLPTMIDLLARAGIAFSPSNTFDLIIEYFVTNNIYDVYEINAALFKYGQPILGE